MNKLIARDFIPPYPPPINKYGKTKPGFIFHKRERFDLSIDNINWIKFSRRIDFQRVSSGILLWDYIGNKFKHRNYFNFYSLNSAIIPCYITEEIVDEFFSSTNSITIRLANSYGVGSKTYVLSLDKGKFIDNKIGKLSEELLNKIKRLGIIVDWKPY